MIGPLKAPPNVRRASRESGALGGRVGLFVSLLSSLCILGWAVPALLTLDKGFSIRDSGSYLLSYRFWDSNPYFVSGSQYVYGPIFEAMGESVPFLRMLRLAMVIGCNAWFGLVFVSWLSRQESVRLPVSRLALVLLITACGGLSYMWAPLTPGYYDLTAQASLVLVTLMLAAISAGADGRWWNPCLVGLVSVVLAVTKWTASPVVVLTVGATAVAIMRTRRPAAVRYLCFVAVGVLAGLGAMNLFVIRIDRFLRVMAAVSSLTARDNHGLGYLARGYFTGAGALVLSAALLGVPLFAGYVMALRYEARSRPRVATAFLATASAVCTLVIPLVTGWHGGSTRGRLVISIALAGLLLAALAAVVPRREPAVGGTSRWPVLVVLVAVPLLQAAGTNLPLLYEAAFCMAMWVAAVLVLAVGNQTSAASSTAVVVGLGVLIVTGTMVAGTQTLMAPFEGGSVVANKNSVADLGLRVSGEAAAEYTALTHALSPYVIRGQTPMFSEDPTAGLIYQLGGVPVGSTWNDQESVHRTAGILELACRSAPINGRLEPVLFLDPHPKPVVVRALRHCGYEFPAHFRELQIAGGPLQVRIFVSTRAPRVASRRAE